MPLVYEMSCLRKRYLSKKDCGCLICHFSLYIYFHIGKQEEKLFEINKGIIMLLLKGHAIMNFTSGILQRIQANFCNVFLFCFWNCITQGYFLSAFIETYFILLGHILRIEMFFCIYFYFDEFSRDYVDNGHYTERWKDNESVWTWAVDD